MVNKISILNISLLINIIRFYIKDDGGGSSSGGGGDDDEDAFQGIIDEFVLYDKLLT